VSGLGWGPAPNGVGTRERRRRDSGAAAEKLPVLLTAPLGFFFILRALPEVSFFTRRRVTLCALFLTVTCTSLQYGVNSNVYCAVLGLVP